MLLSDRGIQIPFPTKRNKGSIGEWPILTMEQKDFVF